MTAPEVPAASVAAPPVTALETNSTVIEVSRGVTNRFIASTPGFFIVGSQGKKYCRSSSHVRQSLVKSHSRRLLTAAAVAWR